MKYCYKCKTDKHLDDFGKDKSRSDGIYPICKGCVNAYQSIWREANKEKRKAAVDKYRSANREKCNASTKKSQAKHPNTKKNWNENNRQKVRLIKRKWAKENTEQNKEIKANNKAKRRGADGKFTFDQIKELLRKQKYKCISCGCDIKKSFHRDHIFPIALGGSNHITNIQLLCAPCNIKKSSKHPVDFMQERGFLI